MASEGQLFGNCSVEIVNSINFGSLSVLKGATFLLFENVEIAKLIFCLKSECTSQRRNIFSNRYYNLLTLKIKPKKKAAL